VPIIKSAGVLHFGSELRDWHRAGQIRFKEDVLDGIERMPEAFLRLLHGKNFGKQIVRIN
jgi:NADPH-dependent curcumin reductase CurA